MCFLLFCFVVLFACLFVCLFVCLLCPCWIYFVCVATHSSFFGWVVVWGVAGSVGGRLGDMFLIVF